MRVHVFIKGKVQGVFFRKNTKNKADELGISGWVKNLADGRVEAVFEGEKNKVKKMIDWCYKGSSASKVEKIEVNKQKEQDLKGFQIKY